MSTANLESVSNNWHDAVGTYKDAQADARTRFYSKKALLSLAIDVSNQNATDYLDNELKNPTQTKSYADMQTDKKMEVDITAGKVLSKFLPNYFKKLFPNIDAAELKRNLAITYYYLDKQGNIDELYVGETVRFPGDATMHIVGKDGTERKVFNLRPKPEGDEEEDADEPVAIPPAKRREVEPPAPPRQAPTEPPAAPTAAPTDAPEPPAPTTQEAPPTPPPAEEPASAPPPGGKKINMDGED